MIKARITGAGTASTPQAQQDSPSASVDAGGFASAVAALRGALGRAWARRWPPRHFFATSEARRRKVRLIDVLRLLGLARRAVPRPVVGPKAYVQWWQRILATLGLVAMLVGVGFVLTAAIGLMAVLGGFLLEQAIA